MQTFLARYRYAPCWVEPARESAGGGALCREKDSSADCEATLAWGINMPAHLVIVKGTEYYNGKTCKYVDFPITDVLQIMGRAGRPQYDTSAVAVIFVQDVKKTF